MQLDSYLMERHIFPALQLDHIQIVEAIPERAIERAIYIVLDFTPNNN